MHEPTARTSLQPPAHPMPGYLAVMPIPAGGETGARVQLGVFSIPTAITAALVIEAGEMIDSRFETIDRLVPGTKVFYPDGCSHRIAGYEYVQVNALICWEGEQ